MEIREALSRMRADCLKLGQPTPTVELPSIAARSLAWSVCDGMGPLLTDYSIKQKDDVVFMYDGIKFIAKDPPRPPKRQWWGLGE